MILDSSVVMAILGAEPGHEQLLDCALANSCRISSANWVEAGIVADQRSLRHGDDLDQLLAALDTEIVAVTPEQARVARSAYRRYGRGSGSPARLNFGDCFAYALSVLTAEPLLFVGDDFTHTDVLAALLPE